jgi:hypothetical protein
MAEPNSRLDCLLAQRTNRAHHGNANGGVNRVGVRR